jgi:hypothetical protein
LPFHEHVIGLKSRHQWIIIIMIIIAIVCITYFSKRKAMQSKRSAVPQEFVLFMLFAFYSLGSFLFMLFTYIFFMLPGRMDNRQLLPVFLSYSLSILSASTLWVNTWLDKSVSWKKILSWSILLLLLFWFYPTSIKSIPTTGFERGFFSSYWDDSELMGFIRQLPPDTQIVSNYPAAILYWADRPSWDIFSFLTPEFVSKTTSYGTDMADPAQVAFSENDGILVIFDTFPIQMSNSFYEAGNLRLNTIFSGLVVLRQYDDGSIYTTPPGGIP